MLNQLAILEARLIFIERALRAGGWQRHTYRDIGQARLVGRGAAQNAAVELGQVGHAHEWPRIDSNHLEEQQSPWCR